MKILFPLLLLFSSPTLIAQIYISTKGQDLFLLDTASCEMTLIPQTRDIRPGYHRVSGTTISKDGNLHTTFSQEFITDFDIRECEIRDTLFESLHHAHPEQFSYNFVGLTIDNEDKLYAASISSYIFNKANGDTSFLGRLPDNTGINGLAVIDSTVYATSYSPQPGIIEFVPGGFPEINRILPLQGTNTIVSYRDDDCKLKLLVSIGWRSSFDSPYVHRLISVDPVDLSYTTFCNRVEAPNSMGETTALWGGISYDRFLTTCDVRLDLDANDNSSRFGPHYYNDATCTRSYQITDTDIWLASKVSDIDSVTVRLRPAGAQAGYDRLGYIADAQVNIVSHNDTALVLSLRNGGTQLDLERAMRRLRLTTTAPRPTVGERVVEFYAFAGGVRSDMARAFIQVDASDLAFAGYDTTLYACRDSAVNLFQRLAPDIDPGGVWSPDLYFGDTWNLGKPYGTYRYVVSNQVCGVADTAYVTIAEPRRPAGYLPLADTTISLCPGDTLMWNLDYPEVATVNWPDGFVGRMRLLTTPGLYTAFIDNAAGCRTDAVSLRVTSADDDSAPGTSMVAACVGDTLLAGALTISSDTVVSNLYQTARGCDSTHLTTYRFTPAPIVKIQESICPGDTAFIAEQFYTEPGSYQASIASDGICDTLLLISISELPSYEVTIDTSLTDGDTLRIGGEILTTSGTYNLYLTTAAGCDSLLQVTVDFLNSTTGVEVTNGYFAPNPLRIGGPGFQFFPNGTDATRLESLKIYDLTGRLVAARSGTDAAWSPGWVQPTVPVGVYLYRAALVNGIRRTIYSGKLVVTR